LKETRDYPHEDKEGKYRLTIIEKKNAGEYVRESMQFPILGTKPRVGKRWQIGIEKAMELEKKGRFINEKGTIKLKIYDFEDKDTYSAQPNLLDDHGTTDSAARMLADIFGKQEVFSNPKPIELIKHLIGIATKKDDVVMDSFAGSGTTGHAVLDLNKEDSGERKFIIIEMEDNVSRDMTAERMKRAIKKYGYKDGFEYCELGKPLFNEGGQIEEECSFEQLATYIYFTETNTNLDKKVVSGNRIGEYGDTQYYLLFREKGKNILNKDFLNKIDKNNNKKVIYADKCLIDDKVLEKYNIQFKQIPYEVKVY
jgi:hypothetical protein